MINKKYKVLLDYTPYNCKPNSNEIKYYINNRLNNGHTELFISELKEYITKGCTFCPATFNGKISNKNFKQKSIFCLDFDSGITPEEILERLNEFRLGYSFFYSTFSDTPSHRKFRVVFEFEIPINDPKIATAINKMLMTIFPEADKSCKDLARIFFGGKEVFYENDQVLTLNNLLNTYEVNVIAQEKHPNNYSRQHKKVRKMMKICSALYNTLSTEHKNINFSHSIIQHIDLDQLSNKISILSDFRKLNSTTHTTTHTHTTSLSKGVWHDGYHKLLGIISNLQYIKGGREWVKDIMNAYGQFKDHHYALLNVIPNSEYKYHPMDLKNFSPFPEDHQYKNILEATGRSDYNTIRLIKPYYVLSLNSAEKILKDVFEKALNDTSNNITVIKTVTGLGKTKLLESLPINLSYTLAFPTHTLKDEVFHRIYSSGKNNITFDVTPKLPELPKIQQDIIDCYYKQGCWQEVQQYLNNLSCDPSIEPKIKKQLEDYHSDNRKAYADNGNSIITTHTKALLKRDDGTFHFDNTDVLIFDEDMISKILKVNAIEKTTLENLLSKIPQEHESLSEYLQQCLNVVNGEATILEAPNLEISANAIDWLISELTGNSNKYQENILELLQANLIAKSNEPFNKERLFYITRNDLPDKKIIILSATADETIYKRLFGNRVKFYDLSHVEPQGSIDLDYKYSCSKTSLSNSHAIDYVTNEIKDDRTVITFKNCKSYIANTDDLSHFGKVEGLDHLKGKDIAVVGMPQPPHIVYALYAKIMGYDIDLSKLELVKKRIKRNGFEFSLNTFEEKIYRHLQFYFIESNLLQAIGRARILRKDANVKVFSGYPVRDFKENVQVIDDYQEYLNKINQTNIEHSSIIHFNSEISKVA